VRQAVFASRVGCRADVAPFTRWVGCGGRRSPVHEPGGVVEVAGADVASFESRVDCGGGRGPIREPGGLQGLT